MKFYISLPISGLNIDRSKERAERSKKLLQQKGHEAITPFDICPDPTEPYSKLMGRDIEGLLQCDAILLLSGWSCSRGCSLEWRCAQIYNKKIYQFFKDVPNA